MERTVKPGLETASADLRTVEAGDLVRRRTLLFVASREIISEALALAIEGEFPWITVEHVDTVDAACGFFIRPVALILIDSTVLGEAEAAAAELRRFHPDAHAAVIEADSRRSRNSMANILGSNLVHSVLPMNLKLDVWLSVVRLMLRGGDYLPADMFYPHGHAAAAMPTRMPAPGKQAELTQRELEVLELVSQGLQNKSIAVQLDVSEHTVKIHLHNIISKLRAHNRTEAAAWFHEYRSSHVEA